MKYIKSILLMTVAAAVLGGCTDKFDEYNTNHYERQDLNVEDFFPAMLDCLASPEENPCQRNNTFWACFGGYVTTPHSWGRSTLYSTFNIDDDWNKWTVDWYYTADGGKGLYPGWFGVQRATNGEGYYYAIAQVIRVYVMQMVASIQGPLPYSQIANGDFYVAYDNEETAWKAMFDDLDAAIVEIRSAAASGSKPLASVDRIFAGDNNKWLTFANTLKLRMAMRISGAPGQEEYARKKAEEAVADGVMTSVAESAYDNLNKRYQNGFFQLSIGWGGEVKANACIVSYMNGYNDPRLAKYFTKAEDGTYTGVRSGVPGMVKGDYLKYSGLIYEGENMKTAPMPIMLAAEAAFLKAEGALKGWNMGGTAKEFYEEGIRLSFEEWKADGADAYIADNTSKPASFDHKDHGCTNKSVCTIAWDESASDEQKLEKIITQKWIAGFPNGLEGWSDFRRTGYPYIFPPYQNLSANPRLDDERGQRRLKFSQSEYERNNANVTAAEAMLDGGNTQGAELWWALKDVKRY